MRVNGTTYDVYRDGMRDVDVAHLGLRGNLMVTACNEDVTLKIKPPGADWATERNQCPRCAAAVGK